VQYHIIENVRKHKIGKRRKTWHGIGEVAVGLDLGLEGVLLAICHHGRGLDGYLASAEDLDGGGHIHYMQVIFGLSQFMVGVIGIRGASMDIPI